MASRIKLFILVLSLALLPGSQTWAAASKYYVPPTDIEAALKVTERESNNTLSVDVSNATAAFSYDSETKQVSALRVALDATSLSLSNQNAMQALRTLLAVRDFPEIKFVASTPTSFEKEGTAEVKGTLTLQGKSKPMTFEGTLESSEGSAIGLTLKGTIKRADFGLSDDPDVPGRFGEEIKLVIKMRGMQL